MRAIFHFALLIFLVGCHKDECAPGFRLTDSGDVESCTTVMASQVDTYRSWRSFLSASACAKTGYSFRLPTNADDGVSCASATGDFFLSTQGADRLKFACRAEDEGKYREVLDEARGTRYYFKCGSSYQSASCDYASGVSYFDSRFFCCPQDRTIVSNDRSSVGCAD